MTKAEWGQLTLEEKAQWVRDHDDLGRPLSERQLEVFAGLMMQAAILWPGKPRWWDLRGWFRYWRARRRVQRVRLGKESVFKR